MGGIGRDGGCREWWVGRQALTAPTYPTPKVLLIARPLRKNITIANNDWVKFCIHGFTNISMTTAFLGVSLGLFDFLADGFKRPDTRFGRFQTACLTFLPPLLINVMLSDPNNFLRYFKSSGIFVAILFFRSRDFLSNFSVAMGIAGSVLPDAVVGIHELKPTRATKWFHTFHFWNHNLIALRVRDWAFLSGATWQLAFFYFLQHRV